MRPLTAERRTLVPNPPARRQPLLRVERRGRGAKPSRAWYARPLPVGAIVLAVLLLGASLILWRSGAIGELQAGIERAIRVSTSTAGFSVRQVSVIGREATPRDDLLAAVGASRGDPILFFDADEARRKVEQIPWVKAAAVRRALPDTILIEIVERVPVARWQIDGQTVLIDREGKVLRGPDMAAYRDLKRVVGPGAAEKAHELFDMLAGEPELAARVKDAVRVRGRRWDIAFDNGVIAMLPEDQPDLAWRHLATLDREKGLLNKAIIAVDLRLPEKLVVKMLPDSLPPPPAPPRKPGKSA